MEITISELKLRARRSLFGNFGTLAGIQIAIYALSIMALPILYLLLLPSIFATAFLRGAVGTGVFTAAVMAAFLVFYVVILILASLLGAGFARIMLDIAQARPVEFKRLLYPFQNHFLRFVGIMALLMLLGALCTVLTFFLKLFAMMHPGYLWMRILITVFQCGLLLWLTASFSQSINILLEQPEKRVFQCMRESYEMMRGNRIRLILLRLSFIGWYLLVFLSFGIGAVWILPYQGCTAGHFYLDLRERRRLFREGWTEGMEAYNGTENN